MNIVINLKERPDRLQSFMRQMAKQTLQIDYDILQPPANKKAPRVGTVRAIQEAVQMNYNKPKFILFEDDVKFTTVNALGILYKKAKIIEELHPESLGFVHSGVMKLFNVKQVTPYFKLSDYWGNQCMIIYKNAYDVILDYKSTGVDACLSQSIQRGEIIGWCISPFVTTQLDGYSDLMKCERVFENKYIYETD